MRRGPIQFNSSDVREHSFQKIQQRETRLSWKLCQTELYTLGDLPVGHKLRVCQLLPTGCFDLYLGDLQDMDEAFGVCGHREALPGPAGFT